MNISSRVSLIAILIFLMAFTIFSCTSDDDEAGRSSSGDDDDDDDNDTGGDDDDDDNDDDDDDDDDDDVLPPAFNYEFHIDDPVSGFYSDRQVFTVTGTLIVPDGANVSYVKVNGENASVEGQTFTVVNLILPEKSLFREIQADAKVSLNENEYRLKDRAYTINSDYHNVDAVLASVGYGRINNSTFEKIEDPIEQELNEIDLWEIVSDMNPLFDETYELLGVEIVSVEANATSASYGTMAVDIEVLNDSMELDYTATDINIDLSVDIEWFDKETGTGRDVSGSVSASAANIHASIFPYVAEQHYQVYLYDLSADLSGFDWDINGFPDELEGLFDSMIRDAIEDALEDALTDILVGYLNDFLNGFEITADFGDYSLELPPRSIFPDTSGLYMEMNGRFKTNVPSPDAPPMMGTLKTESDPPDFGSTVPGSETPFDIAIALDDDFINQALAAIVQSGDLNMSFAGEIDLGGDVLTLDAGTLATFISGFGLYEASEPVTITLSPTLPPFAFPGTEGDLLKISLMDFIVEISTGPSDSLDQALTIALDLDMSGSVDISDDGQYIVIDLSSPDVEILIMGYRFEADEAEIADMLNLLIGFMMPMITDTLGNIPLPDLAGYTLDPVAFMMAGESGDYVSIFTNLQTAE